MYRGLHLGEAFFVVTVGEMTMIFLVDEGTAASNFRVGRGRKT